MPRPRTPSQFITPEFLATKARLEELIHPAPKPSRKTREEDSTLAASAALTDVADNVE